MLFSPSQSFASSRCLGVSSLGRLADESSEAVFKCPLARANTASPPSLFLSQFSVHHRRQLRPEKKQHPSTPAYSTRQVNGCTRSPFALSPFPSASRKMAIRPATPGTVVVGIATVLLIIVSISAPIWKEVFFLKATVGGTEIRLGCWGYCGSTGCTKTTLGYSLGELRSSFVD